MGLSLSLTREMIGLIANILLYAAFYTMTPEYRRYLGLTNRNPSRNQCANIEAKELETRLLDMKGNYRCRYPEVLVASGVRKELWHPTPQNPFVYAKDSKLFCNSLNT